MRSGKSVRADGCCVGLPLIVVDGEEGLGGVFELEVRGELRADMDILEIIRRGGVGNSREKSSERGAGGALNVVSTYEFEALGLVR